MQNDPLSDLRDIHLPDPAGFWPPAPGWWLLAALLSAAAIGLCWWLWQGYRRNRWRVSARRELDNLARSRAPEQERLLELNRLLKRAARARYPDKHPESLSGEDWLAFLQENTPAVAPETLDALRRLAESTWRRHSTLTFSEGEKAVRSWLRGQKC